MVTQGDMHTIGEVFFNRYRPRKTDMNAFCPLGKQLSHFAYLGPPSYLS